MSRLPITDETRRILREQGTDTAAAFHNQQLDGQFALAEAGEVINLSDLMASREVFDVEEARGHMRNEVGETVKLLWNHQYRFTLAGLRGQASTELGRAMDADLHRLRQLGVDIECEQVQAVRLDAVKEAAQNA